MISIIFRDLREIVASIFCTPTPPCLFLSTHDFISILLRFYIYSARQKRWEKGQRCITKAPRCCVYYTNRRTRIFLRERLLRRTLLWSPLPPPPAAFSDPQQWELQTDSDANKVIITKSGRLRSDQHKKPPPWDSTFINAVPGALYADRFNYKRIKTPSSKLFESSWLRRTFFTAALCTWLIRCVNLK